MKTSARFLLPGLGGLILTLSFAPYSLSLIAWIAFIPLFYSLRDGKYPFLKGFIMGIAFFSTLLSWIPFSNIEKEIVPQMVAGYFLLLLYLSCYFGFSGMLYDKLRRMQRIYLFPLVFGGLEFLRSLSSVLGFPWGSLGYSQTNLIYFVQFASLGGVPLVTFWIISINILLYLLADTYAVKNRPSKNYLYLLIGIIVMPFIYSGVVILRGYRSPGEITATVLQPNISPDEKRFSSGREREEIIKEIILDAPDSDIYILPETASPYSLTHSMRTRNFFTDLANRKGGYIITGMPDFDVINTKLYHYNAVGLVDSTGITGVYRKMFLVPFVERLPYDDVIPIFKKINLGQGHFTPGRLFSVFDVGRAKLSVFICYEAIFPQLIREFVLKGAEILVNITEDGWFGKTFAPYQHAEMATFRCIEYRRALLRSANTGVSLIVDPFGRILSRTEIYEEAQLTGVVPLVEGLTVYARIGDTFGWVFLLFAIGLIFIRLDSNGKKTLP